MPELRIIFMGTAALACASLRALLQGKDFQVVAVVTQPDRPKGRDMKLQFSPVKELAVSHGLPVLQPERARNPQFIQELAGYSPELVVVAAYGQILPPALLTLPPFGCINVHASLLPKYRGAAPIQWAILDDEAETGVTIMKMDAGLDTGDILTQAATPIRPEDTAATLHDRLASIGAELLVQTIPDYVTGKVSPTPQLASAATHARKITKEDGRMDWALPARTLWNRIRAFTPWPGAYTTLHADPKPLTLKIWFAQVEEGSGEPGTILNADRNGVVVACRQQALRLLELQREGGRRLKAADFLLGHPLPVGMRLS